MRRDADVVVIGAGLAGLVAAKELVADGRDTVVLEARDRVGGRLLNATLPGGSVVEMGGQWIGPGQDAMRSLIGELALTTYPTFVEGRHLAEIGHRRSAYRGRIPRMNPVVLADIGQTQLRLDRCARKVAQADEPWLARKAESLDAQTFATWLRRTTATRTGRSFYRLITEAVFSAEPEDLSALWAAHYIGAAGGLDALINTAGGAQQDRIVGGSQRVAQALAKNLGDRVALNSVVSAVEWDARGVRVTAGSLTVHARHAVMAIPPPLLTRLHFTPSLPTNRQQLVHRLPMGRVVKVNVVYDQPFWRKAGWSGQANSNRRPLGTVFDNTPESGAPGVLVGFFEGRHADTYSRLDETARRQAALTDLVAYFGSAAADPIDYLELDWAKEEFSGGCYGAFTPPGTLTRFGPALREPIGPLHWAGTETARRWPGYMEGAVESGHRVAREIAELRPRDRPSLLR